MTNIGRPADSVDENKIKHLLNACRYYIYKNSLYNSFVRLDVIEIWLINESKYEINHIKQVV